MNKKTYVPVSGAIRLLTTRPTIRMHKERAAWQSRQNPKFTTAAIYNTGRTLHIDPHGCNATTCYGYHWKWIAYRDFISPSYVVISQRKLFGMMRDTVEFVHEGHRFIGKEGNMGTASIRARSGSVLRRFDIPPMCILYLSVHLGHVKDALLIYQPLPMKLCPVTEEFRLQPVLPQYFVVVKK